MNELKTKLMGCFCSSNVLCNSGVKVKVKISRHLSKNNLTHFATLANKEQSVISTEMYNDVIIPADNEFGVTMKFSETIKFKTHRRIQN